MPDQEQKQDQQFGEADKPYVDPNSGAAPQPGGFAAPVVQVDVEQPKQANPPKDAVLDASIEHQAAPQGSQPGNPDGENANEAGTTEDEAGSGNLSEARDGASPDEDDDDAPKDSSGSSGSKKAKKR